MLAMVQGVLICLLTHAQDVYVLLLALSPQVTCEGDQYGLHVTFMLPAHFKDKCPDQLLASLGVKIHPILFTKGVYI